VGSLTAYGAAGHRGTRWQEGLESAHGADLPEPADRKGRVSLSGAGQSVPLPTKDHAQITRQQCIREESQSFLSRVFGGATGAMLVQFVQQAKLTPKEVAQLRKALEGKKG
jgi:hypothetical protein